tara:strand:+ start:37 stop:438 length:402 start_codon:yes stop_codon:yes gene_type:complete
VPVQRVSKGFKDISMSFQISPLTEDLIAIKNQTAIARSLRNLVLTVTGERFFNASIGSRVNDLLFENFDDITSSAIKDEVELTIKNFEPRVKLIETDVFANPDSLEFEISITYEIVGIDAEAQQLQFALQPTR